MQDFRNGKIQYLLTTDLASRGLDIDELDYVIQYDIPISKESYVHRSGRTGRMRRKGAVLTLVNERELRNFKQLIAPLAIQLTEMYVYGGELTAEKAARAAAEPKAREQKPDQAAVKPVPSSTEEPKKDKPRKPKQPTAEKPVTAPKKKKKNRTKKVKNKGARRHKEKE